MSERELKPCPCCGGTPKIVKFVKDDKHYFSDKWAVQCEYTGDDKGCGLTGQVNKIEDIAIDCWNTRPELNRVLDEVVERLQLCKYTHEEQDHKDDVVSFYDLGFVIKELKGSQ